MKHIKCEKEMSFEEIILLVNIEGYVVMGKEVN